MITVSIQIPFFGNKSSIACFVRAENTPFHFINCFKLQLSLPRILLVHPILFFTPIHLHEIFYNSLYSHAMLHVGPRNISPTIWILLKYFRIFFVQYCTIFYNSWSSHAIPHVGPRNIYHHFNFFLYYFLYRYPYHLLWDLRCKM